MTDDQIDFLGAAPSLGLDLGSPAGLGAPPAAKATPGHLPAIAPTSAPTASAAYRVLARKYRPSRFEDLIGQEAMVRTLTNAFALNRIHQAYLLTGVRGIGKTTTARILARAFNYELPAHDGHPAINAPSVSMPELGVHCQAIIESRHVDVIELDAASHTGVDDVREIIENSRYRPVMARCKVYIIDEVHMLSKAAFNALLKTLEEPPEHVRFLLATTEIDKVPITVRSRCMRFDLRRIEADTLIQHLSGICEQEQVAIAPDALALIARASEGSVRDSLSLMDQAIAHGAAPGDDAISAKTMRDMLGVADRARVIDLFESTMKGDVAGGLDNLREQYEQGADPSHVLTDLAEFTHYVTLLKIAPPAQRDPSVTQDEHNRGTDFASKLSLAALTRAWQLLSAGLQEIKDSPRPLACADMILVRLAHASELPTPEDLIRRLNSAPASTESRPSSPSGGGGGGGGGGTVMASGGGALRMASVQAMPVSAPTAQAQPNAAPRVQIARFEDIVALAHVNRDIQLKMALERDVHIIRFEQGSIEFSLSEGASAQIAQTLMRRLQEWTGTRWMVAISREAGAPSIKDVQDAQEAVKMTGVRALPLVRQALDIFPGAEIVAVRTADLEPAQLGQPAGGDDIAYIDQVDSDDDF